MFKAQTDILGASNVVRHINVTEAVGISSPDALRGSLDVSVEQGAYIRHAQ